MRQAEHRLTHHDKQTDFHVGTGGLALWYRDIDLNHITQPWIQLHTHKSWTLYLEDILELLEDSVHFFFKQPVEFLLLPKMENNKWSPARLFKTNTGKWDGTVSHISGNLSRYWWTTPHAPFMSVWMNTGADAATVSHWRLWCNP